MMKVFRKFTNFVNCKNYTIISVNTSLGEKNRKKSSSGRPNCHIFGIIGNLFENAREWCHLHADILDTFRVIQVSNLEIDMHVFISNDTECLGT